MAANRLDQFRGSMARLDASAGPQETIQGGYYVTPPGKSIADELAARLSLTPSSSHIVLGGAGSGKTTQLMLVCEQLNGIEDTQALYIDVSAECDLQTLDLLDLDLMLARRILRLSGIHRGARSELNEVIQAAEEAANAFADLKWQEHWVEVQYDYLQGELWRTLLDLRRTLGNIQPHLIVVLDSLDRLTDVGRFAKIVSIWLPRLTAIEVGAVLTAPLAALYGTSRSLLDRVDRYHHLSYLDVRDQESRDFLGRVLRARIPMTLCPDPPCDRLVELSGGVLRDLIALTRSAVEEAYVQGEDIVTMEQVELAADAFGRKHLLGLERKPRHVV